MARVGADRGCRRSLRNARSYTILVVFGRADFASSNAAGPRRACLARDPEPGRRRQTLYVGWSLCLGGPARIATRRTLPSPATTVRRRAITANGRSSSRALAVRVHNPRSSSHPSTSAPAVRFRPTDVGRHALATRGAGRSSAHRRESCRNARAGASVPALPAHAASLARGSTTTPTGWCGGRRSVRPPQARPQRVAETCLAGQTAGPPILAGLTGEEIFGRGEVHAAGSCI